MADAPDKDQQTEAASPKKLDDAAKRGDVAVAADVRQLAMLAAALAIVAAGLGPAMRGLADVSVSFWGRADAMALSPDAARALLATLAGHAALILGVPLAIALAAAIIGGAGQGRFIIASERIAPQWQRLSPIAGLKRLFGAEAMVQFGKTLAKIALVGAAAWGASGATLAALRADNAVSLSAALASSATALLWAIVLATGAIALFDLLWSKLSFARRMRMSRDEQRRESRDSEGDPHLKARLKAIRLQRGRRRMVAAAETATVVVMNPTHYAVALRYDHAVGAPPVVVAKGMDRMALLIRDRAAAAGVAVVQDPPLARALYAAAEIDQPIPVEHFEAVAKVIGFVLRAAKSYKA